MIIRVKELRAMGWCSYGIREVARRSNINWSKFISEGMELEELVQKIDPQFGKELEDKYGRRR